jgi:hypothetical protein
MFQSKKWFSLALDTTNMVLVYQYIPFPIGFNWPISSFILLVAFYKAGTNDDLHSV